MKFRIRDNNKQASIKQSCDTYITTFEGNIIKVIIDI